MNKISKIAIASILLIGIITTIFALNAKEELPSPNLSSIPNSSLENHYSSYLSLYGNIKDITDTHTINLDDLSIMGEELKLDSGIFLWENNSTISFEVDIKNEGYYFIYFDYTSLVDSHNPIILSVFINDTLPYFEASQIMLDTLWTEAEATGIDRYGNDVNVMQTPYYEWQRAVLKDAGKLYHQGIGFYLENGTNKIKIEKLSGSLRVREIIMKGKETYPTYQEYLTKYDQKVQNRFYEIEAEETTYKNSTSIIRGTSRDVSVTPFSKSKLKLNVLGVDSYHLPGDAASWVVDIEEEGFYYVTFKILQKQQYKTAYRSLTINGEIPFQEAEHLGFPYSRNWQNVTLSSLENKPFLIYLKPNDILSLVVDSSLFVNISEKIKKLTSEMTNLGLDITKLTRNNVDRNIDWDMIIYFPNLKEQLNKWMSEMDEIIQLLQSLYGYQNDAQIIQDIRASKYKIKELASDINEIPRRLTLLSTGASSAVQLLSSQIDLVLNQSMIVDKFYLHSEINQLPSPNGSLFKKIWVAISRFFLSFFDTDYQEKAESDELEVWVNRSRQYVDLLQKMTDDVFTRNSGIKVKVSLMNNDSKLILANSANQEPDVALGISAWIPIEYGMRGMLHDFRLSNNYQEFIKTYNPVQLIPLVYDNKLYGLPETENFFVLFYRKDIMEQLSLNVPNTWDDVIELLPVLDRYGMSFYVPLSTMDSFKAFGVTVPFIQQFNGRIYSDDGLEAAVDNEGTIQALTFMTDLYREYSLPQQVPSFFNSFRYGTIPLGIADFGTYLQLVNTASEIRGLWDIALIPGISYEKEEGALINRSAGGAERVAIVFEKSDKKEEAWAFLQWWLSTQTQSLYSELLVNTLGSRYLWNSANFEAFRNNSWDESHKKVILAQWEHLNEIPKLPGSYIIEREISNIFNNVIYEDANIRNTVSESILKMNKEIKRKMAEFGYVDSLGNPIKPFLVPDVNEIKKWLSYE